MMHGMKTAEHAEHLMLEEFSALFASHRDVLERALPWLASDIRRRIHDDHAQRPCWVICVDSVEGEGLVFGTTRISPAPLWWLAQQALHEGTARFGV
jgi:hypothetical protein